MNMLGITNYGINFRDAIDALHNKGKLAFVSWGGGGAGVFYDTYNNSKFITGVVNQIVAAHTKYNFDGLDIDLEHRSGDFHECGQAILSIIAQVKQKIPTLFIACAPQQSNLRPRLPGYPSGNQSVKSGNNEYAPILGGYVPGSNQQIKGIELFDLVQPQFYNADIIGGGTYTEKYQTQYIEDLSDGYVAEWVNDAGHKNTYNVKVPSTKLVMGYPAAPQAASTGYSDQTPVELVRQGWVGGFITDNKIRGVMTWSIGWDDQNKYAWSKEMKTIINN